MAFVADKSLDPYRLEDVDFSGRDRPEQPTPYPHCSRDDDVRTMALWGLILSSNTATILHSYFPCKCTSPWLSLSGYLILFLAYGPANSEPHDPDPFQLVLWPCWHLGYRSRAAYFESSALLHRTFHLLPAIEHCYRPSACT